METALQYDVRTLMALILLMSGRAWADESIDRYFDALDLDGDGYVSLAEAAGDPVIVTRFDRADRDRDGKLSRKEFANLKKVKVRIAGTKKKEPSAAAGGSAAKPR